ncbi:hypothetical protein HDU93_007849 [Gonapodya sp. JEL0774]|nr:hypothetical protein HDU93_007849 [Gonapodya sp. JEL0774]
MLAELYQPNLRSSLDHYAPSHLSDMAAAAFSTARPATETYPRRDLARGMSEREFPPFHPTRSSSDLVHPPERHMERPSRTVFVRCIANHTPAGAVRAVFEEFGEVKSATNVIERKGIMFITYYDIRCAEKSVQELNGFCMDGRAWDCHFSLPKTGSELRTIDEEENQGTVFVKARNLQPLDSMELFSFMQQFGEVKVVKDIKSGPHEKLVEFYDSRNAVRAVHNAPIIGFRGLPLDFHYAWDFPKPVRAQTTYRRIEALRQNGFLGGPAPPTRSARRDPESYLDQFRTEVSPSDSSYQRHELTIPRHVEQVASLGFPGPLSAPSFGGLRETRGPSPQAGWPTPLPSPPPLIVTRRSHDGQSLVSTEPTGLNVSTNIHGLGVGTTKAETPLVQSTQTDRAGMTPVLIPTSQLQNVALLLQMQAQAEAAHRHGGATHPLEQGTRASALYGNPQQLPTGNISISDSSSNGTNVDGRKVSEATRGLVRGKSHEIELSDDFFFLISDREAIAQEAQRNSSSRIRILPFDTRCNVSKSPSPYHITRHVLGRGSYSVVKLAIDKRTNTRLACKIVDRRLTPFRAVDGQGASVARECGIMRRVEHPNVVRLHAVYTTANHAYVMLTLARGRDLYEEIKAQGRMPEGRARFAFFQVAMAVGWLHDMGVVHRDIKIENILVDSSHSSNLPRIMLGDFGMAKVVEHIIVICETGSYLLLFQIAMSDSALRTRCGTPFYLAPEVLADEKTPYDKAVDIWASGVVLYMLGGVFPFYSPSDRHLREAIATAEPVFHEPYFAGVSPQARDLVCRMLRKNPSNRPTAAEVLQHPWLASKRTTLDKLYRKVVLSGWATSEMEGSKAVTGGEDGESKLLSPHRKSEVIDLSKTGLKSLPAKGYKHLKRCRRMVVAGNELDEIPDGIQEMKALTELDFSGNTMRFFPRKLPAQITWINAFGNLTQLEEVILEENPDLIMFPSSMSNLGQLKVVNIRNTKLETLPVECASWHALEELIMRDNTQMEVLPDFIGQLGSLIKFDANTCSLVALPDDIGFLSKLSVLDVRNNQLSSHSIPQSIYNLRQLSRLYLSNNQIEVLPDELCQLPFLVELDVSNNFLYNLPDDIGQLARLEKLLASANKLDKLPVSIGNMSSLTVLELRGNAFNAIPDAIGQLTALTKLDISRNKIVELPIALGNLSNLATLDIKDNPIFKPPQEILHLPLHELLAYLRNPKEGKSRQREGATLGEVPGATLRRNRGKAQ